MSSALKPRFKLGTNGHVYLMRAGLSGMDEKQTRQYMENQCGSVHLYCQRFGLPYAETTGALRSFTESMNSAHSAMRAVLGLPWSPKRERVNYKGVSPVYTCIVNALGAADPDTPQPLPIKIGTVPKKVVWEPHA